MFVILFLFHSVKLCCLLLFECPLGLGLHFYCLKQSLQLDWKIRINALSGWGSISTWRIIFRGTRKGFRYQCPFWLKLHFYTCSNFSKKFSENLYQCPFGLKLHFYEQKYQELVRRAKEYQCPFGLKLHFYRP